MSARWTCQRGPPVGEDRRLEGVLAFLSRLARRCDRVRDLFLEGSVRIDDGHWRKFTAVAAACSDEWCYEVARRRDACCRAQPAAS